MKTMKPASRNNICIVFVLWLVGIVMAGCSVPTAVPQPTPTQTTATARPTEQTEGVVLTMGSWRTDDVTQMNQILAKFHEKYPNITIKFTPTDAPSYNAVLAAQLKGGSAPDLFYLRSYAVSRTLFEQNYLEALDTVPGLKDNFTPAMLAPWATDDGKPYGVPFIATSHGVYYNVDVFKSLNLKEPTTWEELLSTAQKVKDSGLTPFANASGDTWTMAEIVFMNLAPDFIGGREGRMAYLNGQRCFNDAHIVATFQAVKDIASFLPQNQKLLKYADSLQLFLQGKAAMWFGGSWDIPFFEAQKPGFTWTVFAVPPPAGQKPYLTFQLDAGMGLNSASKYKPEARKFLEWMTSTEFGELLGNELPGFFPMLTKAPVLNNQHANAVLALNTGRETDVRFTWEKLMEGSPSAYDLVRDGAVAVVNGDQTPQQAADALQAGLAQWFEPAKKCNK